MERDFEATGGASDLQEFSDFNLDGLAAIEVDSWDAGFVDHELFVNHSGSDNLSQYEPSINMASGQSHVGVDVSSFSGFNFRNTLRDATLSNNATLPDLPWETPMWRCIFDESFDPLESINPTRLLSGPSLPVYLMRRFQFFHWQLVIVEM